MKWEEVRGGEMKNNVIHLPMRSPFTIFAPKLRPMDIASVIQSPITAELEDFRQLFERSLSSSNPLLNRVIEHIRQRSGK